MTKPQRDPQSTPPPVPKAPDSPDNGHRLQHTPPTGIAVANYASSGFDEETINPFTPTPMVSHPAIELPESQISRCASWLTSLKGICAVLFAAVLLGAGGITYVTQFATTAEVQKSQIEAVNRAIAEDKRHTDAIEAHPYYYREVRDFTIRFERLESKLDTVIRLLDHEPAPRKRPR